MITITFFDYLFHYYNPFAAPNHMYRNNIKKVKHVNTTHRDTKINNMRDTRFTSSTRLCPPNLVLYLFIKEKKLQSWGTYIAPFSLPQISSQRDTFRIPISLLEGLVTNSQFNNRSFSTRGFKFPK